MGKNKKHILKDELIDKAVKDSINNFVNSIKKKDDVSLRIDGYIPDVGKYIKTYSNLGSFKENVSEGLVKTYPVDKARNYIIRKYGLSDSQVQTQVINNGIVSVDLICVILHNNTDRNTMGGIKHDLKTCGYFNMQEPTPIDGTDYFAIPFEPKFSDDIGDLIRKKFRYLYHSAPQIYADKISKNGLIPKSKSTLFFYPDRAYFMVGDELSREQMGMIKSIQDRRNAQLDTNNPKENKEYVLITIDVSKLPSDISFYSDPMAKMAVFSYDNIPPSAIVEIEPFTL